MYIYIYIHIHLFIYIMGAQAAPAWPGATAGFVPYQAPVKIFM